MAALNVENLKAVLHHLHDQRPVEETKQKDLHAQIDELDAEPKDEEVEEVDDSPPGFKRNADGTYSREI